MSHPFPRFAHKHSTVARRDQFERRLFGSSPEQLRSLANWPLEREVEEGDGIDGAILETGLGSAGAVLEANAPEGGKPGSMSGRLHLVKELTKIFFHTDRKSTRLNSSHMSISYAVFCLKK